ncbi:RNA-binding S4 domain-containing protein [Rhodocyclaceae bacterium SMB388]
MISFELRGEFIQLDQLLKAAGLVGTGGEAHAAVEAGRVHVDGRAESRKRAKLRVGQRVTMAGQTVQLVSPAADAPG